MTNVMNFKVTVNGKVTECRQSLCKVFDNADKERFRAEYCWITDIKTPSTATINVHYRLQLSESNGQANFVYFLRCGALWVGPIHKEVVTVLVPKNLKVKINSPISYKPKAQGDDKIVWEILDAKPTEDIELVVSSKATKKKPHQKHEPKNQQ
jgi:hypothetical protein